MTPVEVNSVVNAINGVEFLLLAIAILLLALVITQLGRK